MKKYQTIKKLVSALVIALLVTLATLAIFALIFSFLFINYYFVQTFNEQILWFMGYSMQMASGLFLISTALFIVATVLTSIVKE